MRKPREKPKKIDREKFYIVDLVSLHSPKLLWNEFDSESEAEFAMVRYLKNFGKRYLVCKGNRAKVHALRFYKENLASRDKKNRVVWVFIPKYDIPPRLKLEWKDRKHFRRLERRRLKKLENR